jgi:hypothetical protein
VHNTSSTRCCGAQRWRGLKEMCSNFLWKNIAVKSIFYAIDITHTRRPVHNIEQIPCLIGAPEEHTVAQFQISQRPTCSKYCAEIFMSILSIVNHAPLSHFPLIAWSSRLF